MARDGVAVEARIAAAVAAYVRADRRGNVAAVCRELGISRQTFYKYVRRFHAIGVEGFFPDSRRPRSSPQRLPAALEDVLIAIRKSEAEQGWDYGADAVLLRLEERRVVEPDLWPAERPLPSRSSVNRVFDQRGQLVKVPQRRPRRRGGRRFERAEVNALWQFDGFEYKLADGTVAVVLHLTDDCSRLDLALEAVVSENGADIWATFCLAVERYGLPVQVLTDNGSGFSGKRRGWISDFERRLYELAVEPICSRVGHPQTCGKNERAHQRVLKWLQRRPRPATRDELQALLDEYRTGYNTRRNMVLGKLTPLERFDLGPIVAPLPAPADAPGGLSCARTAVTRHTVTRTGSIGLDGTLIGVGRRHAGHAALAFRTGDHVTVFIDNEYVRDLTLDHSHRYQPQDR